MRSRHAKAKPDVFERIKQDFDAGDFEKARDRLHGLVNSHPEDLELRLALGDVYARLGDFERAGQYWYLAENKTQEMLDACAAFEKACGKHPPTIAKRLRWPGDVEAVPCPRARDMLKQLPRKRDGGCVLAGFGYLWLGVLLVAGAAVILFLIFLIQAIVSDPA